nr:MAG TPA: hypothetical protein [Caudoviricetes sp.]
MSPLFIRVCGYVIGYCNQGHQIAITYNIFTYYKYTRK